VQASLTGHLVFSTLHTNDAPGATTRLVDMGIEPYLVSSSLEMVLAQRLVRLICKHCREETPVADLKAMREEFGDLVPEVTYRGRGCRQCQGSGFRGRTGIFEMMPISEEIRAMIIEHASAGQVRRKAVEQGMKSLREDGWRLVKDGKTTIEEVVRNTKEEQVTRATEETPDSYGVQPLG
jgi:type II secretory ATPase GspE/PulE/Tfp pilus assembly ATPase PilB-like protein